MSPPWRSELRLHLRQRQCEAALVGGWWRRQVRARARAEGDTARSLPQAIAALREGVTANRAAWPATRLPVRLTVPDERVYYALLPAAGTWAQQAAQARRQIVDALGRDDLSLRSVLLPGGRHWLVAALDRDDLAAWTQTLDGAGVRLAHVHPALVEDLRLLAPRRHHASALLVLLRDEGAALVRLSHGQPCALAWERVDPRQHAALARRVHAFALGAPADDDDAPVVVLPHDRAQHDALIGTAVAERWRLLAPLRVGGEVAA